MNKGNYLHMKQYDMLHTFYVKFKVKIDVIVFIATLFGVIEANRIKISLFGTKQGTVDTGIAEETSVLKIALAKAIRKNAGPATGKFKSLGKFKLATQLKISYAKMLKMRPEKLIEIANMVVATLTINIADLTGTGVTVATIATISDAVVAYTPEADASQAAIKSKTVVTENIKNAIIENSEIINNQLKPGMEIFMDTEADMYAEFLKDVELPHEGTNSKRAPAVPKAEVTLTFIHDLTEEPLVDVVTKFLGTRGSFTSDENGVIKAKLPLGDQLAKIISVDMLNKNYPFNLTEAGLVAVIRLIPTGV